jgi:hypothetical protein
MMRDSVKEDVVYIFVCLNACGQAPAYFILTPSEVRDKLKQYRTRGVVPVASLQAFEDQWQQIDRASQ